MNRDSFLATRQPNGDVWISAKQRQYRRDFQPLAPEDSDPIIIPKADRLELARLLLWPRDPEPSYKTDYSRCAGEPE